MLTSKKLSQKIKESGFEGESEMYWVISNDDDSNEWKLVSKEYIENAYMQFGAFKDYIPAYDILNDICVRYCHEFFPEYNRDKQPKDGSESLNPNGKMQITRKILTMMQLQEPQDEIEKYTEKTAIIFKK